MQVYSETTVQQHYPMAQAIEDIENVFRHLDDIQTAQRTVIPTGDGAKSMLYMPCVDTAKPVSYTHLTLPTTPYV